MAGDDAQQTLAAEGSEAGNWVTAFAVQRKLIEQGIRDRLSPRDRAFRLAEADGALPDAYLPDSDALQHIADLLEEKLQEMLRVVLSKGCPDLGVRLPPGFDFGSDLESLRDTVSRDERQWLFKGGIQEILYRFRDQGNALVMEERNRLLKSLSARVQQLEKVIAELNAHPVVAQALDADETLRIERTLEAARAIATRYSSILTSREAGVAPLLEDNYYQLQGQFTAACAQLCLQLYGNVSNLHLRDLLQLKALYVLDVLPSNDPPASLKETERKHLERKRDLMLKRVMLLAKKESWPTWPILQLYRYDQRFGRLPAKEHHQQHEAAMSTAGIPSELRGIPVVAGW